jgi:hypothetical protein
MKWSSNAPIASLKNLNASLVHPATAWAAVREKVRVLVHKREIAPAAAVPHMKYRDMKVEFKVFPDSPA